MAQTKILNCNCSNAHQDKIYGIGRRLHNEYVKPSPGGYRCTVCDKNKAG